MLTLVYGIPMIHAIAEAGEHHTGILDKILNDVFAKPAPVGILQRERSIPVVERSHGYDAVF